MACVVCGLCVYMWCCVCVVCGEAWHTLSLFFSLFTLLSSLLSFVSSSYLYLLFFFFFFFSSSFSCSCSCSFSFSSLSSSRHQSTNTAADIEAFECDLAKDKCTAVGSLPPPLPSLLPSPPPLLKNKKRGNFLLQEYSRRGIYF